MIDRAKRWRPSGWAIAAALFVFAESLAVVSSDQAAAEKFPNRPIRMIVPFPLSGPTDVIARLLSERLSALLGQPIIIENHAGSAGTLGAKLVIGAAPDGYTLLFSASGPFAIAPAIDPDLGYDPLKVFTPVAIVATSPQVLVVNASVPAKSVHDLIAYAKANPSKIHFGSPGFGTQPHLLGELLRTMAAISISHVPSQGSAPAISALLTGTVQMYFAAPAVIAPYIATGKLRALAVAGENRARMLPNVPTMIESGFGRFIASYWTAVAVPSGASSKVISRLNIAINGSLQASDIQARLAELGMEAKPSTSPSAASFIAAEMQRWSVVARAVGVQSPPSSAGTTTSR